MRCGSPAPGPAASKGPRSATGGCPYGWHRRPCLWCGVFCRRECSPRHAVALRGTQQRAATGMGNARPHRTPGGRAAPYGVAHRRRSDTGRASRTAPRNLPTPGSPLQGTFSLFPFAFRLLPSLPPPGEAIMADQPVVSQGEGRQEQGVQQQQSVYRVAGRLSPHLKNEHRHDDGLRGVDHDRRG